MNYDQDKMDQMALALLYLTTFDENGYKRAWKSLAWEITDRLYEKEYIEDPKSKNKSVVLTPKGAKCSEELFNKHFKMSSE